MYITKTEAEALLGRSLTDIENTNFTLYQNIAITRIEDLICQSLDDILSSLEIEKLPVDLMLVLARIIGCITNENSVEYGVNEKKVEDFSISYNAGINKVYALTIEANAQTLMKYSKCCSIAHGRTLREERKYYDNIR